MNDDAFEALVPFLTPSLPVDPTERDYLIKLIVTIRHASLYHAIIAIGIFFVKKQIISHKQKF